MSCRRSPTPRPRTPCRRSTSAPPGRSSILCRPARCGTLEAPPGMSRRPLCIGPRNPPGPPSNTALRLSGGRIWVPRPGVSFESLQLRPLHAAECAGRNEQPGLARGRSCFPGGVRSTWPFAAAAAWVCLFFPPSATAVLSCRRILSPIDFLSFLWSAIQFWPASGETQGCCLGALRRTNPSLGEVGSR